MQHQKLSTAGIKLVKSIFVIFFFSLIPIASHAENTPEYFGVYAHYKNGKLIELNRQTKLQTGNGCMRISKDDMVSMTRVPVRAYVADKPTVTIDLSKVDAFYIYGDSQIENHTSISYFASYEYYNNSLCTDDVFGGDKPVYIDINYSCGPADGMKYKKIKDGLYKFKFPVKESSDYQFCDMFVGKTAGSGKDDWKPKVQVSFYGWYYGGNYYTFSTKKAVPFQSMRSTPTNSTSKLSMTQNVKKSNAVIDQQNNVALKTNPTTLKLKKEMAIKLVAYTLQNGKMGIKKTLSYDDKLLFGVTLTKSFTHLKKFQCKEYSVISYESGKAITKLDPGKVCKVKGKWYPYILLTDSSRQNVSGDEFTEAMIGKW